MKTYEPPKNDQTYFITKYALTDGIVKALGHSCDNGDGRMISVVWTDRYRHSLFHKPHWHTSQEDAVARVEVMKTAKVKSLRKQLANLEGFKPSVDDRTALADAPETEE